MSAVITVTNLTKKYGALTAVDGVSFEVAPGTIFGLLGPNGAGKTSVLECLVGLRQPDGGTVRLGGSVGVALQETALQDRITPREALRLFGAFYPVSVPPDALLARFSLREKADAPYDSLSAGQRQRLALALAFVNTPDILVLDEPTAGLDPQSRRELHQTIRQWRDEGRTVLLATHYLEEAHLLCDRIAILRGGRIAAAGRPDELIARSPALPRIALRTSAPVSPGLIEALPGVSGVEHTDGELRFQTAQVGPAVVGVVGLLEHEGNELLDLRVWRPSLEDTFLELTDDHGTRPLP